MTTTEVLMFSQTAVLALTAIILVYYTIEARRLRVAAAAQLEVMQRKEKRDEWRDAIRDADRLLNEHLDIVLRGLDGQFTDRRRLLNHVADEVRKANKSYDASYADSVFAKYTADANVAFFRPTAMLVWDIWNLLDGFAENLMEQDGRLLSFYISYFQGVTTRLQTIGAIHQSTWEKDLGRIVAKLMQKSAGFATSLANNSGSAAVH
jgi:hypothetical protein